MNDLFDQNSDIDELQFVIDPQSSDLDEDEKKIVNAIVNHNWSFSASSVQNPNVLLIEGADTVGFGVSAQAYRVRVQGTRTFILKLIDSPYLNSPVHRLRTFREIISLIINHQSYDVIAGYGSRLLMNKFADIDRSAGKLAIFLEDIQGENLEEYFSLNGDIQVAEKIDVICKIMRQIHVLHHRGIIHRDIKPKNIIVSNSNPSNIRIIDFGGITYIAEPTIKGDGSYIKKIDDYSSSSPQLVRASTDINMPMSLTQHVNWQSPGTPEYMSPEHYGGNCVAGSDVWSMGIMMIEILTGTKQILFEIGYEVSHLMKTVGVDLISCAPSDNIILDRICEKFPNFEDKIRDNNFLEFYLQQLLHPVGDERPKTGLASEVLEKKKEEVKKLDKSNNGKDAYSTLVSISKKIQNAFQ